MLDHLGLVATIEWQIDEFQKQTNCSPENIIFALRIITMMV